MTSYYRNIMTMRSSGSGGSLWDIDTANGVDQIMVRAVSEQCSSTVLHHYVPCCSRVFCANRKQVTVKEKLLAWGPWEVQGAYRLRW